MIDFLGAEELKLLRKHARHVGVALEGIPGNQGEDLFQLAAVVNVFGKDIFVQRIPGRTVDEEEFVFLVIAGQLAEKIPAPLPLDRRAAVFQLHAGPENGPFGARS